MPSLDPVAQWIGRLRAAAVPALLLAAAWIFVRFVDQFYPIEHWLFWRYATYWGACLFWSAACVAAGHYTIRRLLGRTLPIAEHLATSFAVGVFEFFLGMFLFGMARLYDAGLFFGLPLVMLAVGGQDLWRYLRRATCRLRAHRRRIGRAPVWTWAIVAFGLLGLLMIYFLILTPDNTQFDARWKHLAMAEDYVAYGGVRRFPEGSTVATYPHLASFVYAWAFLLPFGRIFDHVLLAAHMEFTVFVWTLLGIVGLVRQLVPRTHGHLAWAARFLFPGVFLYDSSLSAGADHIGALFAVPVFTLMLRSYRELCPRYTSLLALVMAGGALVKYTAAMMLFPVPVAVLAIRAVVLAVRRKRLAPRARSNWWRGPLAVVVVGLVVTAPHWLKNIIWYGDPLYPMLHKYLTLRPWHQDAADLFEWGYKDYQFWRPERDWEGVKETLTAMVHWSLVPNDYMKFHGKVPVIGSLFTLLLVPLPFLRGRGRLWGLIGLVHGALFIWYWTHHQDRYLQTLMPLMTAVTASCIILLWRSHLLTRLALVVLIGLQIVWGGDVYFMQTHAMVRSPIKKVVDLLNAGRKRKYEQRLDNILTGFPKAAKHLPRGARVLLHDNHVHTGLGATSVSDWGGWQFGISYGRLHNSREVYDLLRSMGVTHLHWRKQTSKGWDSVGGDLMFFHFATQVAGKSKAIGSMRIAPMPSKPPPAEPFEDTVAYLGCKGTYPLGLYRLRDLTVPVFGPRRKAFPSPRWREATRSMSSDELCQRASFVVVDTACANGMPAGARSQFDQVATRKRVNGPRRSWRRKSIQLWLRTAGQAEPLAGVTPGDEAPTEATGRRPVEPPAPRAVPGRVKRRAAPDSTEDPEEQGGPPFAPEPDDG